MKRTLWLRYWRRSAAIVARLRRQGFLPRIQVWCLTGAERHTGVSLTVVFAGGATTMRYVEYVVFGQAEAVKSLGQAWIWRVSRLALRACQPDLQFIETSSRWYRWLAHDVDFFLPAWIEGTITQRRMRERMQRSLRKNLRRIDKQGYRYEITREPAELKDYYERMYRPYMRNTHGNRAVIVPYEHMIRHADIGELILVKQGEEAVAGAMILFERRQVRTWSLGVRDGDHEHVRRGATAALYYFNMLYLQELGIEACNFGGSRAFLADGALQFKRLWGFELTQSRRHGFWLQHAHSAGALAFLLNNPFIHVHNGMLCGIGFARSGDEENMRTRLELLARGLGLQELALRGVTGGATLEGTPRCARDRRNAAHAPVSRPPAYGSVSGDGETVLGLREGSCADS